MSIENGRYWSRAWSLVDGCTPCSPGCDNCWSAAINLRFRGEEENGLLKVKNLNQWGFSGKVIFREDRLDIPLKTRKPTVFSVWNDLFHEDVDDDFIAHVYSHMWESGWEWWVKYDVSCGHGPGHTFLILTKRHKRMANLLTDNIFWKSVVKAGALDSRGLLPVPYIWHGITVCNQSEADEKIPELLKVPGHKWLSIEPLLENLDFGGWPISTSPDVMDFSYSTPRETVDWVVVGAETGPHHRPCDIEWIRSIVLQCQYAGVPVWVKAVDLGKRVSHNMDEWPEDIRVREVPWVK